MKSAPLLLLLTLFIIGGCDSSPSPSPDVKAAVKDEAPKNWEYRDSKDEMTGEAIHIACTTSIDGRVTLCIRRWGAKLDSYLKIHEGQFFCYEEHCSTKVKVDDGGAVSLQGEEAESGDTRTIFLSGSVMLKKVRSAEGGDLMIQPPLYDEGIHVFHFDTDDLVWK
jgi:hypothetical protein